MKTQNNRNLNSNPTANVTSKASKRTFFDEVLDGVKYVGDGLGDFNIDGTRSAFTIEDGNFFKGMNRLTWLGYEVAKIALTNPDRCLPQHYSDGARIVKRVLIGNEKGDNEALCEAKNEKCKGYIPTDFISYGDTIVDDVVSAVIESLLTSLREGERDTAIATAFKAVDKVLQRDDWSKRSNKTLPKEEVVCKVDVGLIEALIGGATSYEVGYEVDGEIVAVRYEVSPALSAIFEAVKTSHPFGFKDNGKNGCTRWQCFEYFVLNVPTAKIAETLKMSTQRVYKLVKETCEWLLDEVKNADFATVTDLKNDYKTMQVLKALVEVATA